MGQNHCLCYKIIIFITKFNPMIQQLLLWIWVMLCCEMAMAEAAQFQEPPHLLIRLGLFPGRVEVGQILMVVASDFRLSKPSLTDQHQMRAIIGMTKSSQRHGFHESKQGFHMIPASSKFMQSVFSNLCSLKIIYSVFILFLNSDSGSPC